MQCMYEKDKWTQKQEAAFFLHVTGHVTMFLCVDAVLFNIYITTILNQ